MKDNATVIGVTYRRSYMPGLEEEVRSVNFVIPRPNMRLDEALDDISIMLGDVDIRGVQMLGGAIVMPEEQIPLPGLDGGNLPDPLGGGLEP